MKEEIISNLDNPVQLERLYRSDKPAFRRTFNLLYPEIKDNGYARFWHARLNYSKEEISWGTGKDLVFVIVASVLAGFIAKLPDILNIDPQSFYPRNIGFVVFPALTAYFLWKNRLSTDKIAFIAGITLASLIFINLLPDVTKSDTVMLSCIHLVLVLWALLGFAFVGEKNNIPVKRLGYLKYNGDLLVMTALIVIAGGILSGITIGLFALIGINIEKFYFENIVVFCLPAAPIVGTYLTQSNPQLVGKVSPVIARIFSPLVLVMLVIYLGAIIYSGKDPYNDREFLLLFNVLLVGVMAIIFFSVAEHSRSNKTKAETWILVLLSLVTLVVNGIALSAILFRISEWGMTPNRAAVLGSNVLILVNLLLVAAQLVKALKKDGDTSGVRKVISSYLPIYCVWFTVVTFLFPYLFGFQ